MIEPWEQVESEPCGDYHVFRVRRNRCRSPRTGRHHTFHVIEAPDWINVIPVTPEGQIVMIEQYRHGTEAVTLEIPGGMVDPGETPAASAARELEEETGYASGPLALLGSVAPNPAIQNNRCHTFLAPDARPYGRQRLEGSEIIDVRLVEPEQVRRLILGGAITHALTVAAFYLYDHRAQAHGR